MIIGNFRGLCCCCGGGGQLFLLALENGRGRGGGGGTSAGKLHYEWIIHKAPSWRVSSSPRIFNVVARIRYIIFRLVL